MLRVSGVQGLAHVATISFLAGRLTPVGAFWVSLAGGVALARAAARAGARAGYGASIAAMVETVAVMGPARISGPLTQALNAPALGALHARGHGAVVLLAVCTSIRLAHYAVINALLLWLVLGSIDAYVETFDSVAELALGILPSGQTAALTLTLVANLAAAAFYSVVQVVVVRRALSTPVAAPPVASIPAARDDPAPSPRRVRALAWGTVAVWVLLLTALAWPVLAAVAGLLAVGTVAVRAPRWPPLRLTVLLGTALALGALGPAALGAVEVDEALRRGVRAFLLVASAGVTQALIGPEGVRALAAGALRVLRRVPAVSEASLLAPELRGEPRLIAGTRELIARVTEAAPRPSRLADAVIGWVGDEEARHR